MTYFPHHIKTYPNMDSAFPFYLTLKQLRSGYPAHKHDCLELSYVVDGNGSESINGVVHPMTAGTFTFVLPDQVHELFTPPGSTIRLYNCMFSMDLLMDGKDGEGWEALLTDWDAQGAFVALQGAEHEAMLQRFEEMLDEYNQERPWRASLLRLKLKETLIQFDRCRPKQISPPVTAIRNNTPLIWRLVHYMHQHYQDELSLTTLSHHFSISPSRISELIKQSTGQTFVHFVHALRIRHACGLLVSTEMNVTEIALETGYSSYKTFSRVFREIKGTAPTTYRNHKRKADLIEITPRTHDFLN